MTTETAPTIRVKLTDDEWRVQCEKLAKTELRRKRKRKQLEDEREEWNTRKKDLESQIDTLSDLCESLAKAVDTREAEMPAQAEIPGAEAPPPADGSDDEKEE